LRLCRDFAHHDTLLVASRIGKRNMQITVCLNFQINNAASKCVPIILNPDTF
jgi:hypothetical protein